MLEEVEVVLTIILEYGDVLIHLTFLHCLDTDNNTHMIQHEVCDLLHE